MEILDSYGSYSDYKSFIEKPIEILQKEKSQRNKTFLKKKDLILKVYSSKEE